MLVNQTVETNTNPVIGIVAQPIDPVLKAKYPNCSSYIESSYVKFFETAGARVVPLIPDDQTSLAFVSKLNGVVFPGGQGDYN